MAFFLALFFPLLVIALTIFPGNGVEAREEREGVVGKGKVGRGEVVREGGKRVR